MSNVVERLKNKLGPNAGRVLLVMGGIAALYSVYLYAPVIKAGADARYSYADVHRYYAIDREMSDILGVPGMKSHREAFANLALAGMEKSLLAAKDVHVVRDAAIALVDNRAFAKGTLKKLKSEYGIDDYYRLVVEPIVTAEIFNGYYRVNDPNRKVADDILKAAQAYGLLQAGNRAGMKITQMAIPYAVTNQLFVEETKRSVGAVYGRLIEDPGFYCVCVIREVKADGVLVDGIMIPRKPVYDFIVDEMKANKVPISYALISIFKEGAVKSAFAVEPKDETKNAKNSDKK